MICHSVADRSRNMSMSMKMNMVMNIMCTGMKMNMVKNLEDLGRSERSSCRKSIGHEATGYEGGEITYGRQERDIDYIDHHCTSDDVLSSPKFKQEDDTLGSSDGIMDKNR